MERRVWVAACPLIAMAIVLVCPCQMFLWLAPVGHCEELLRRSNLVSNGIASPSARNDMRTGVNRRSIPCHSEGEARRIFKADSSLHHASRNLAQNDKSALAPPSNLEEVRRAIAQAEAVRQKINDKVTRMKETLRQRARGRTKYGQLPNVLKMIDHLRYITREELEVRMRIIVDALNRELKQVDSYAVIWDHDPHKSRRWMFTMALPWLVKPPVAAGYMCENGYERIKEKDPQVLVIFDDAVYSGMDITDSLITVHHQFPGKKVILAIPFMGNRALRDHHLQEWRDLKLLANKNGDPAYELLLSLDQVVDPSRLDSGDFGWQHLAVLEHKGPPDTFSIPSSLFTLFWSDTYWRHKGYMNKDPDAVIAHYKQPGPYYDQEEQDFPLGAVEFASTGPVASFPDQQQCVSCSL